MARTNNLTNFLTDVADSIREKTGKSDPIACEDFDTEIESIETGGGIEISDASYLFYNNARTNIFSEFMSALKNVTSTKSMFYGVTNNSIENIDLSNGELNGLNVVDTFYQMFYGATNIKTVKLSSTSTIPTTLQALFYNCTNITSVDISGINISSINQFSSIFEGCKSLVTIKIPNSFFKGTNTGNYYHVFQSCLKLETINGVPFTTFVEENIFPLYSATFEGFFNCNKLKFKSLPNNITSVSQRSFQYCYGLTQVSMNVTGIAGTATGNPAFLGCINIVAFWLGSKFNNTGAVYNGNYGLYIGGNKKLKKIFIDRPRSEVETISGYNYAFQGTTAQSAKDIIICNDDEGFMTREEFDAIDWENYTEE